MRHTTRNPKTGRFTRGWPLPDPIVDKTTGKVSYPIKYEIEPLHIQVKPEVFETSLWKRFIRWVK